MIALAYLDARGQLTADWAELIEEYLLELAAGDASAATLRLRRDQLTHLARALDCPPAEVDRAMLVAWMGTQSWATETRRSYRAAVRGFFGWAAALGRLDGDPAAGLPVIRQRPGVPRPVPEQTYHSALAAASPAARLMLRLAREVGLRRGEIARIHSTDLRRDELGPVLLVHGKGRKQRMVPIPDDLAAAIGAADGWLFPNGRAGHVSPQWVGELCADLLGGHWTLHSLRHAFASRAYAATRDLRAVQVLLGHSSPTVTQRYVATDSADLRAAMSAARPVARAVAAAAMMVFVLTSCVADEACEDFTGQSPAGVVRCAA